MISIATSGGSPDLAALCAAALDLDADEAPAIVERLAAPPPGRRTKVLVAAEGDRSVGVVFVSCSDTDANLGYVDLIAVRPEARRRGVGRALLTAAERALAELGATEVRLAGNTPCYGWPGIDVRYTPAICLALAAGYEEYRYATNMTVELRTAPLDTTADEARLAAAGVEVRRVVPADLPRLTAWIDEEWGAGWPWETAVAAGCHLAERAGELLGFAAYGANRLSWFGPMGTAPAARGLGIGSVLLRRCLADQRDAGLERAQIGWVGPVRFYAGTVSARLERVFRLYRKPL